MSDDKVLIQMPYPHNGRIVLAKAPSGVSKVFLGVHPKTTNALVSSGRLAALGEFVGLLYGLDILMTPTAIFQGLNRPYYGTVADASVYAYITKPNCSYTFAGVSPNFGIGPIQVPAPVDSVFVSFVTFAKDVVADVALTLPKDPIGGAILYWEWTLADVTLPHMPDGYQTRYRRIAWKQI